MTPPRPRYTPTALTGRLKRRVNMGQTASTQPRARLAPKEASAPTSLVASAARLTKKSIEKGGSFKATLAESWQDDAWEMTDLIGEQHFLVTTLANQGSKARFYVGILPKGADATDRPKPVQDDRLQNVLSQFGGGPVRFQQMVQRMLVNLSVAGGGWFVGIPRPLLPDFEEDDYDEGEAPTLPDLQAGEELTMEDMEWRMLSVSEVTFPSRGSIRLKLGEDVQREQPEVDMDLVYPIRVWRSHPRFSWQADSPTRSSLPVLRELVGLNMHVAASIDSRLAGAGMLIVPASAARAAKIAAGIPEDSDEDPYTDALMESMLTPIGDRSAASAVVPLVTTVPDESTGHFQHITFAKPLDTEARALREEAIRRLALGQDAPPELLLGGGDSNHWTAWLRQGDTVHTHLEPPLALIADALTEQFLRPLMGEMGYKDSDIEEMVVWYDVEHLIERPNRGTDAQSLFAAGELGGKALRAATGFDETDAPAQAAMDLATATAFDMVIATPGLMNNPGLPALVDQLKALIAGNPVPLPKKGEATKSAIPVDENMQPITTTNPQAGQAAPGGTATSSPPQNFPQNSAPAAPAAPAAPTPGQRPNGQTGPQLPQTVQVPQQTTAPQPGSIRASVDGEGDSAGTFGTWEGYEPVEDYVSQFSTASTTTEEQTDTSSTESTEADTEEFATQAEIDLVIRAWYRIKQGATQPGDEELVARHEAVRKDLDASKQDHSDELFPPDEEALASTKILLSGEVVRS